MEKCSPEKWKSKDELIDELVRLRKENAELKRQQPEPVISLELGENDQFVGMPGTKEKFRCDCGCNVFRRYKGTNIVSCNGCHSRYQGQPIERS